MAAQPRPATVVRTSAFDRLLNDLPKEVKKTALDKIKALEKDWTDPWLNKTKMGGYDTKWRFKVNTQYRMVANKKDGDEFHLEFVGTKNAFKKKY